MKLKELIPPFLVKRLTGLFYGWSGDYSSWEEAKRKCSGYDSNIIFDKVKSSLLKVKNRQAAYERDSVLFDKIHYSYPLLAALQHIARLNNNKLNVLDFGGSLGSSYFQNRRILSGLSEFNWCVVEQGHFVAEGKNNFSDNHLHFFYNINECLQEYKINTVLLSSVIQYIQKPYELLEQVVATNIDYIIIDRAPVLLKGTDRITIQTVPPQIYKAKYPSHLLNENNMLKPFLNNYEVVFDETLAESIHVDNAAFRFFFLKRK